MEIPPQIVDVLSKSEELHGEVLQAITRFEPWIKLNKLEFFPEYTDHGIEHLEGVLRSAAFLISNEAWSLLRSGDAAALVLSTLLHDAGMHLSASGFKSLIVEGAWQPPLEYTNDKSWAFLWDEFLREVARFDGRKLNQLFGDTRPVQPPSDDPSEWSHRDNLLIGEFLRRHHPRLAHEIAVYGVPGVGEEPLRLGLSDSVLADLVGLIARSHGMPLRSALALLRKRFGNPFRDFKKTYSPYAMAVLRLADYLQVGPERAPESYSEKIQGLRSPISCREWNINQAIENITCTHDDPEAIIVTAYPEGADEFLRLQGLFADLQIEFDSCWAILGEVYGRFGNLRDLGFKFRRICSNLDDVGEFSNNVSYVPCHAKFTTTESELIALLIRPLYGNKPEMGIRELMQNSIDAVRELRQYKSEHHISMPESVDEGADVMISIERNTEDEWEVVISDRGIGMTSDTVCNYFLRAGASFRNSGFWLREFVDEHNHAKLLRSGRFGIGALAAFLLGDRIHVSTRHISAPEERGIEFDAAIDMDTIELKYVRRQVGTTIRIRIAEDLAEKFKKTETWDWYCLSEPVVVRRHSEVARALPQRVNYPLANSELPVEWRRASVDGYLDVQWNPTQDGLACNGIRIRGVHPPVRLFGRRDIPNFPLFVHPFTLSVFDADGLLPLTLTRDKLQDRNPEFLNEIESDYLHELLAYLLINGPTSYPSGYGNSWIDRITGFARIRWLLDSSGHWHGPVGCLGTKDGFGLAEQWTIRNANIERIILLPLGNNCDQKISALCIDNSRHAFAVFKHQIAAMAWGPTPEAASWEHLVFDSKMFRVADQQPALSCWAAGCRTTMPKEAEQEANAFFSKRTSAFPTVAPSVHREEMDQEWLVRADGACPSDTTYEERMSKACSEVGGARSDWMVGQWFFDDCNPNVPPSRLMQLWIDIIGQPLIPYDMEQRRRELKHAFDELKPYIDLFGG